MNAQRIEEFKKCFDKAINDLENLHVLLLDNKSIRANETDKAMKHCTQMNDDVQKAIRTVIDNGKLKSMFNVMQECVIYLENETNRWT